MEISVIFDEENDFTSDGTLVDLRFTSNLGGFFEISSTYFEDWADVLNKLILSFENTGTASAELECEPLKVSILNTGQTYFLEIYKMNSRESTYIGFESLVHFRMIFLQLLEKYIFTYSINNKDYENYSFIKNIIEIKNRL